MGTRDQRMLYKALAADDGEALARALAAGADPMAPDPGKTGWSTAWCSAAAAGCGRRTGEVLAAACDPAGHDEGGWTAFHWAAAFDNAELLVFLLETNPGGALLFSDDEVETALHVASGRDGSECCRILLDAGAAPGEVSRNGRNAFHMAMLSSGMREGSAAQVLAELRPSDEGWGLMDHYSLLPRDLMTGRSATRRGREIWGREADRIEAVRRFCEVAGGVGGGLSPSRPPRAV